MQIEATIDQVRQGLQKLRDEGGFVKMDGLAKGTAEIRGVRANFNYKEGVLHVELVDVPFFVDEGYVERKVREFFD